MLAFAPGPTELLIILIVVLVLFGGAKLPKLARSLGQAQREFREGVTEAEQARSDSPSAETSGDSGRSAKRSDT